MKAAPRLAVGGMFFGWGFSMATLLERYQKKSRRRRRHAARAHTRLDIQGLRMVAVLTVFACHLWGWPRGGFIGVDVFFVISGFLITGNLLRSAESRGNVSFRSFYWNRVRRIVPAATVVLIVTYLASLLVFLPFRSHQIGIDALSAFFFMSNWRFAIEGTDYFAAAAATVSPLQHYWSLSIEEQFYFVWPALIFAISLVVLRKAWGHQQRMMLAGVVMSAIVAASLGFAVYETASASMWAYFDTFARVWELGVGALLACMVGAFAHLAAATRTIMSWSGLALIAASIFLISEGSAGFPAPWALLPVTGSALVIAAGVGVEPKYQSFLRNPVSGYIGDISYSLYLVHWPVIVLLGSLMDAGWYYAVTVLTVAFALAIASYQFVEKPLRKADREKFRAAFRDVRKRRYETQLSTKYAFVGAVSLLAVAGVAYSLRPDAYAPPTAPPDLVAIAPEQVDPSGGDPQLGPLATALQQEITTALSATEWPQLDPSTTPWGEPDAYPHDMNQCTSATEPTEELCTWGSPTAPIRIVLLGDSVAGDYANVLRSIALNSDGQIQVHSEALGGCSFTTGPRGDEAARSNAACEPRKQHAIKWINEHKPTIVTIANKYYEGVPQSEWFENGRTIIEQIRGSTEKIVLLAPPPADKNIRECYGVRGNAPADCISRVESEWLSDAKADQRLAEAVGGVWIDSRIWHCRSGLCPAFVGSTPTKVDSAHTTMAYEEKTYPVILEALRAAGVL